MHQILAITKKELRNYFNSPLAYIFISIFLVITGFLFFRSFFITGQATMRSYFNLVPWLFLFLIPAITMRLWAEEKKLNTTEILFTWPVKDFEAVIAKFLASFIFIGITLILSLSIPISISFLGDLDWGIIIASYIGTLFLAGSFLAIGLYLSSLTDNQIIAFIISIAACFVLFIISENLILLSIPKFLVNVFQYLGISYHFANIARGVLDSRDIIYYLSTIGIFLYLNTRQIEKRKWN